MSLISSGQTYEAIRLPWMAVPSVAVASSSLLLV